MNTLSASVALYLLTVEGNSSGFLNFKLAFQVCAEVTAKMKKRKLRFVYHCTHKIVPPVMMKHCSYSDPMIHI
ncbi:hypothetical protein EDD16DRAFT_1623511 [Pisolithus croceorrhizus]|nr:hypothetical protein EV401DRAFT_2032284 [Pisolithus croceorrhizus]KAI6107232.1 hypothetical protein EDD16DRAFT_1623511 [Pisolithus croceorrhizus]KAI6143196.1 hypothetical protein EDD17DRAFT_1660770 [Pisolithus thermaeus]